MQKYEIHRHVTRHALLCAEPTRRLLTELASAQGNLFDMIKASIATTFCNAASRAVRIAELIKAGSVDLIDTFALRRFESLNLPSGERFIYEFRCSVPTGDFVATGYCPRAVCISSAMRLHLPLS